MLLSNKIKLLSLFGAFIICANLANATETVGFTFYYESGITDVGYTYNQTYDGTNIESVSITPIELSTTVSVTAKMDDKQSIANSFFSHLNSNTSYMVGLNTTDSKPSKLDFWIGGTLSINGENVAQTFYLALIPDHWWLGVIGGQTYTGGNGVNSQTNRGLQVYGETTQQPYCLKEVGDSYYNVHVFTGYCDDTMNQETEKEEFILKWGKNVSNLSFKPLSSPESGQITSKTSSNAQSQTIIDITATPLDSSSIANSFNVLTGHNNLCGMGNGAETVYRFQVHAQGLDCGPIPKFLDFYVSGYMLINGQYVVNSSDGSAREFVLAYGEGRWWLGTIDSPFEKYGGGGVTYDNHATVVTSQTGNNKPYAAYNLDAVSDNSFTVKYTGSTK